MIIPDDIYRDSKTQALIASGVTYGTLVHTYEVRQVMDVRNLTTVRAYRVTCTQRIVIPNKTAFDPEPSHVTEYAGYPALIASSMTLNAPGSKDVRLLTYSPRTLNTSVSTSHTGSDGSSKSVSRQRTSGSSTSETNTYGANASFGFFGDDLTGSFGMDYSHSETDERNKSTSRGTDHGTSHETGASESMSVKDWASYTYLSSGADLSTVPTWVWGQEYPWDVISYRDTPTTGAVKVPEFVLDRLFDSATAPTQVFPPSQLSMFGVDLTMKAAWLVDLPAEFDQQSVTFTHGFDYATGSHGLAGSPLAPVIQFSPVVGGIPSISSKSLDLTRLGLDPVAGRGGSGGAVIGFIPGKFVVPPVDRKEFKILSEENTLEVTGVGFDSVMKTKWVDTKDPITLTIAFKVLDADYDYSLYFKHWIVGTTSWQMTFVFNGDPTTQIVRHVESQEGEGGNDNLTVVNLRNKDYTSIDYHDYLVMGLNTVEVTFTPNAVLADYELRAVAIGGS